MSITGAGDADGGEPTKVGVAIADVVTGMLGAVSVLGALVARAAQRGPASGLGQRIDVSLLGATMAGLVNQAQNAFVTGIAPGRLGNAHPNIVPYETFETADGAIALAVGSERQWARFCEALGMAELAADARFASNGDRVVNRGTLRPILAARLAERGSRDWLAVLDSADVPCAPINDIVSAFASEDALALGMTVEVPHAEWGSIRQVGVPFQLSVTPASVRSAPPALGQDTDAVLTEVGYTGAEIADLHARRVV
jgi:crotonobetainyl-CoA:carnitine CoA-transferase CaiB-like acyl-CoA transferase